jgi:hypothetical protein
MQCCTNAANPAIIVRGTLSAIDSLQFYAEQTVLPATSVERSLTSGVSPPIS